MHKYIRLESKKLYEIKNVDEAFDDLNEKIEDLEQIEDFLVVNGIKILTLIKNKQNIII